MRTETNEAAIVKFRVPGGGIEPNVPNIKQAENEINEEALMRVSDIHDHDFVYIRENIKQNPMKRGNFDYKGKYIHMYSAMYNGPFTGFVAEKDRDEKFVKEGKFYDVLEVFNELPVPYKRVVTERFPAIKARLMAEDDFIG